MIELMFKQNTGTGCINRSILPGHGGQPFFKRLYRSQNNSLKKREGGKKDSI